jgi:hypothetical protein
MAVEEVAGGFGGKKLALASIGFAEVRAGGAFKDDYLDGAVSVRVRLPDVGAAVRVRNCRSQRLGWRVKGVLDACVCLYSVGVMLMRTGTVYLETHLADGRELSYF